MHAPRSHKVPTQLAFHKLHKRAEQWPLKGRDSSQVLWVLSPGDAVRWQGAAQCSAPLAAQVGLGAAADLQGSVVWTSHCGPTALTSVPPRAGASYTGQRVQTATSDPPDVCTYVAPLRLSHSHIWTHKNSLLYVIEGSYKMLQKHRE